jgi:hypothetical protein
MARTLFAFCKQDVESTVCRVPLEAGVQSEVEQMFDAQETAFLEGKDIPIPFTGDWKPDDNELLSIEDADLLIPFNETLTKGPTAYDRLDLSSYDEAGVKALFMHSKAAPAQILIQGFRTSQYLQRKGLTLTFNRNQFGKLSEQGFSLGERLSAVVTGNTVLFASFPVLRMFLTVQEHFTEATSLEVDAFAGNDAFEITDRAAFDDHMDERCRKLIRGITKSRVLEKHKVEEIVRRAASVGLALEENSGKIVLPSVKSELKVVLSFLEESVYKGVLTEETLITNSKRPVR